MPAKIGYQCAINQIRAITFKSMPFKIDAICVSEHFQQGFKPFTTAPIENSAVFHSSIL